MLGIYAFWETDLGQWVFLFIHIALVYSILVLNGKRLKWRKLYKKQVVENLREAHNYLSSINNILEFVYEYDKWHGRGLFLYKKDDQWYMCYADEAPRDANTDDKSSTEEEIMKQNENNDENN